MKSLINPDSYRYIWSSRSQSISTNELTTLQNVSCKLSLSLTGIATKSTYQYSKNSFRGSNWNWIVSGLSSGLYSGQLSFMQRADADNLPTPLNLQGWKNVRLQQDSSVLHQIIAGIMSVLSLQAILSPPAMIMLHLSTILARPDHIIIAPIASALPSFEEAKK